MQEKQNEITMPLKCADCESTEVCENTTGVSVDTYFLWNGKKYVENYEDSECYGDIYIECGNCNTRYSAAEYEAWQLSNPECK